MNLQKNGVRKGQFDEYEDIRLNLSPWLIMKSGQHHVLLRGRILEEL